MLEGSVAITSKSRIFFCCSRDLHRLGIVRVLRRVVGGQQQLQQQTTTHRSPVTVTMTHTVHAQGTLLGRVEELEEVREEPAMSTPPRASVTTPAMRAWTCLQVGALLYKISFI